MNKKLILAALIALAPINNCMAKPSSNRALFATCATTSTLAATVFVINAILVGKKFDFNSFTLLMNDGEKDNHAKCGLISVGALALSLAGCSYFR